VAITTAHNYMGHGFYQFSPELFFRVFSVENGFALRKLVLFESLKADAPFYQVNDPAITGQRTELFSARPMLLAVLAQRTAVTPIFLQPPQQSDYAAVWQQHRETAKAAESRTGWVWRMRTKLSPHWPHWLSRWKVNWLARRKSGPPRLSNRRHFRLLTKREIAGERSQSQKI
jgi:hypothetical protein